MSLQVQRTCEWRVEVEFNKQLSELTHWTQFAKSNQTAQVMDKHYISCLTLLYEKKIVLILKVSFRFIKSSLHVLKMFSSYSGYKKTYGTESRAEASKNRQTELHQFQMSALALKSIVAYDEVQAVFMPCVTSLHWTL